jgi:hypothetical protein
VYEYTRTCTLSFLNWLGVLKQEFNILGRQGEARILHLNAKRKTTIVQEDMAQ